MGKSVDLTGQTFNRWTVLRQNGKDKHGNILWLCECSCEDKTQRNVMTSALINGKSRSCGCLQREWAKNRFSKYENLIGQNFGRWTVLYEAKGKYDKNGYTVRYWYCKCSCGTEREVSESALKKGSSKSCGCLQKEKVKKSGERNRQDFRYEIGQSVETNLGSVTITDRIRKQKNKKSGKYYYYKCNVCGYECDDEHIIYEISLKNGHGCSVCGGGNAVQRGINDIATVASWMLPYFKNVNDAYTHSIGCRDVIDFKCINCGHEYEKILANAYKYGLHCPVCEDGYSYPEKFMMSVLNQLKVPYKFQLTKSFFKWCGKYKYDFYLPDYNMIIETHGEQHYFNNGTFTITVDEQKEIDKIKMDLAIDNNINYKVIDCRYSNIEWIKNSIVSELGVIFDLSNVDWMLCHSNGLKNVVKEICDYYMNNDKPSTVELSKIFPYYYTTISNYLKNGAKLGWCDYDSKIASNLSRHKSSMIKNIKLWYKNEYIGTFHGTTELIKYVQEHYNITLKANSISETCNGKQKTTKGFICQYVQ